MSSRVPDHLVSKLSKERKEALTEAAKKVIEARQANNPDAIELASRQMKTVMLGLVVDFQKGGESPDAAWGMAELLAEQTVEAIQMNEAVLLGRQDWQQRILVDSSPPGKGTGRGA